MNQKTTDELLLVLNQIDREKELFEYTENTADMPHLTFAEYFSSLEKVKRMQKSELIRRSGLERTYGYQLLRGTRNPRRDNAVLLCRTAELDLTETQRLLEVTNLGILYSRNRRDAILIFCFNQNLPVSDMEELLDRMGEETLQKNA